VRLATSPPKTSSTLSKARASTPVSSPPPPYLHPGPPRARKPATNSTPLAWTQSSSSRKSVSGSATSSGVRMPVGLGKLLSLTGTGSKERQLQTERQSYSLTHLDEPTVHIFFLVTMPLGSSVPIVVLFVCNCCKFFLKFNQRRIMLRFFTFSKKNLLLARLSPQKKKKRHETWDGEKRRQIKILKSKRERKKWDGGGDRRIRGDDTRSSR
jgi:hypothetical protein